MTNNQQKKYVCNCGYADDKVHWHSPTCTIFIGIELNNQQNSDWREEFDKRVKELRDQNPQLYKESEPVEFGYSIDRDSELFRVVDFGNIKAFISSTIQSEKDKAVKERDLQILEIIESYIKYTSEEVKELNKDLDSRTQEESYLKSLGMIQAQKDIINLITSPTRATMGNMEE